jgi:sigma-E factor negative regulatory protein RseA
MKEDISALIDGEVERGARFDRLVAGVKSDAALRDTWDTYHLIGDVLRGTAAGSFGRDGFAAKLASEPVVLAPRAPATAAPKATRRWIMPMAASVAALAFVAWAALPILNLEPAAPVAQVTPTATPVAANPSQTVGVPVGVAAIPANPVAPPAITPVAQGVDDYLWAHQGFSSAGGLHGAAPYVRLVSEHESRR